MALILFCFNDTATPEIYTLSLHDALPISSEPVALPRSASGAHPACTRKPLCTSAIAMPRDRKSTRLNSSHVSISYAVFCLKKKKKKVNRKRIDGLIRKPHAYDCRTTAQPR